MRTPTPYYARQGDAMRMIANLLCLAVVLWLLRGLWSIGWPGVAAWLLLMGLCLPSAERD